MSLGSILRIFSSSRRGSSSAALQIPHPEYCAKYDADKSLAVKTRTNAYQYIRDNQLVVAGMHLPFSGIILNFEKE